MFLRVRNFGTAHPDLFPESSPAGESLAVVARAAAAIETHMTAKLAADAEVRKVKSRTRAALRTQMKAVARTVRGLALQEESLVKRLRMPSKRTDVALASAARFFIQEAEVMQEKLVRMGLPPTVVIDLRTLVDGLEATSEQRRAGQASRASAQQGLSTALNQGTRAVRILDVIVVNVLRDDPMRLAAWNIARRLERSSRASSNSAKAETAGVAELPTAS
jgi:hypothetical protein